MLNSLTKSVKSSKVFKQLYSGFLLLAKFAHIKPKMLTMVLGLLVVVLVALALGGRNNEGFYSMRYATKNQDAVIKDMTNAIDMTTWKSTSDKDAFKKKVTDFYSIKMKFLTQGDNSMNKYDVGGPGTLTKPDGLVYKLNSDYIAVNGGKTDTSGNVYKDNSGNTFPIYVDNTMDKPKDAFLKMYSFVNTGSNPVSSEQVSSAKKEVITQINTLSSTDISRLTTAFDALSKNADDMFKVATSYTDMNKSLDDLIYEKHLSAMANRNDAANILGQRSTDSSSDSFGQWGSYAGSGYGSGSGSGSSGRRVYNDFDADSYGYGSGSAYGSSGRSVYKDIDADNYDDNYGWNLAGERERRERERAREIEKERERARDRERERAREIEKERERARDRERERRERAVNYKNSTPSYGSLLGDNNGITAANIPQGDSDLYMLKSRIVPMSPPGPGPGMPSQGMPSQGMPGQGMPGQDMPGQDMPGPSSANTCAPAPVPPCPPCERCPEPAFDCKRVPKYNSAANNQYLPRPVLADFSQFGM